MTGSSLYPPAVGFPHLELVSEIDSEKKGRVKSRGYETTRNGGNLRKLRGHSSPLAGGVAADFPRMFIDYPPERVAREGNYRVLAGNLCTEHLRTID